MTAATAPAADAVLSPDDCWDAVLRRDAAYDGRFYFSVATTGVYCRPSCPARRPKRENVRFHATGNEAERAGFRPCRRCRPDAPSLGERHANLVAEACRHIERAEEAPDLAALARQAGLSPYHFHRIFKAVTGITPKAYAAAQRRQRVREALTRRQSVTAALYDAGFNSSGRFYAEAPAALGMRPGEYQAGGRNVVVRFAITACSLGFILVAATEKGVCAILMGDAPEPLARDLARRFPQAQLIGGDAAFGETVAAVVDFVEAPGRSFPLPLDIRGTAFQEQVWRALQAIPPGRTASYTEIAAKLGRPQAVRAVAGACAQNPLAVAIPCHRVVRADGGLAGYRWGLKRKEALLAREASD
ncbi:MAG: bifunctional DNA-binding transcriptional regulator/O6-methylguanine-DNA methyltransferase Ada [Sphingomonadales bacterium]|nr:bifunctional DNA-binding transcriptional regulator/O6-methylguanine-DNA methyltransferase Ada [Sphingomonadales bacterium]